MERRQAYLRKDNLPTHEEFLAHDCYNPTGNKPIDDFSICRDNIPKIVYSRNLKEVEWRNTNLEREIMKEEFSVLMPPTGKNILVGSPSLISVFLNLDLVNEFQPGVHPVILGGGLPLFKSINDRIGLRLTKKLTLVVGR